MITKSKQQWTVGSSVKVGFLTGLLVVAVVPTPGDFAPDAYLLSRNNQFYSFVPHNGLTGIDANEARRMVAESRAQAERAASLAIAKAQQVAAHAELINKLIFA